MNKKTIITCAVCDKWIEYDPTKAYHNNECPDCLGSGKIADSILMVVGILILLTIVL